MRLQSPNAPTTTLTRGPTSPAAQGGQITPSSPAQRRTCRAESDGGAPVGYAAALWFLRGAACYK